MAEEWNSCSSLTNTKEFKDAKEKYVELLNDNKDPLSYIIQMQYDLQKALYKRLPNQTIDVTDLDTLGTKYKWLRDNKIAFDDEYSELIDALPGMSNMSAKDRTSLWKTWKGEHQNVQKMKFSELNDNDKDEAKYELIDMMHFFFNMIIAMDISGEEIFTYYYSKNAENHNRANNGY